MDGNVSDLIEDALEKYKLAREAIREQSERIREDLRFSNPAKPEQWDDEISRMRDGRVMLTLDRTNQFISQIVNDARQNKQSIYVIPADTNAHPEVAKRLMQMIRYTEYRSNASTAYDTAIELAARCGLGWIRPVPTMQKGSQEIRIMRVTDPLSICLDPDSSEYDGSDAEYGFAEASLSRELFERRYPKADLAGFDTEQWFSDDGIRIAEYFQQEVTQIPACDIILPDGTKQSVDEDDMSDIVARYGPPKIVDTYKRDEKKVKWYKMSGVEILEETEFPSEWIPLVPVLGYELWVDGKRYICGMVRRMMDSQRLHNYEMSALTESLVTQPKAPFLVSNRALEGHEDEWAELNSGNPSALTYNDIDKQGRPIAQPTRLYPPNYPTGFANAAQMAIAEMQAAVGIYNPGLGQPSNATSGVAKREDQRRGDTANFHYADNFRRSLTHLGRIVLDMMDTLCHKSGTAKMMNQAEEPSCLEIDLDMPQPLMTVNGEVVAINPKIGQYDVMVKSGPGYLTARLEAKQGLIELSSGNPQLSLALAPLIVKLGDMPEADLVARLVSAMLPPQVQDVYKQEQQQKSSIPPDVQMEMQQHVQQIQQLTQGVQHATQVIQDLQGQLQQKDTSTQEQVKSAMNEIKAAKAGLEQQAAEIDNKKALFEKDVEIARLRLSRSSGDRHQGL